MKHYEYSPRPTQKWTSHIIILANQNMIMSTVFILASNPDCKTLPPMNVISGTLKTHYVAFSFNCPWYMLCHIGSIFQVYFDIVSTNNNMMKINYYRCPIHTKGIMYSIHHSYWVVRQGNRYNFQLIQNT
jgi:hypothetical protein